MALTDKNILITPNIGAAADPKIVFSGADASTAAQNITLTVYPTNGGTLSFDGSTGQLFSVTNSMSGTIFSANDVSGIPSIEVIDTGLVKIAQYSGNVLLGTGTDTGLAKLQVTGSLSLTGNILHSPTGRSIYGPNPSWSSYLYVGGDGVNGISRTGSIASIVTTNGNMHIDSGSDKAMYLNHYSGTGGIQFGNGAQSITATLTAAGVFNGTNVTVNGNQTLHAGNYTSYSPTLTGGSASGSWGISVTGSAGSVNGLTLTRIGTGISPDSVVQNQIGYNTSVSLFGQTDGGLYSSAHDSSWVHQIYGDFRTGQIAIRGKNNTTWQAWRTVLDSGNYTSYSPTLTGGSASGTWGINITGSATNTSSISSAVGSSYTWTAAQYFQSNLGTTLGALSSPPLQAYATGTNAAFMSFHRSGAYAVNMGLDSDNVFRIGGWSAAANRLQMDMSGNLTMAGTITGTNLSGTNTGDNPGVTSVSGTAPVVSSGGTAPAISMAAASASVNGYLTSANWTTFNGKQAAGTYLSSSNYTSYSPSLTGGSASGTWGISITGTAGTCSGNSATTTMAANRTDGTAYQVVWGTSGSTSQLYSCAAVTITSSTGTLSASILTATSDIRVKTNIKKIDNALEKVLQLRGVTYDRTDIDVSRQTGVIAQEVLKVLPEAVTGSEETQYAVAYGNMVGLLIEAIKDQQTIIDSQESRIARLEALVSKLIEG